MPPLRRKRHVEVDEEYEEFEDDADNMSDDEDAEEFSEDEPESQRDEEMLDDDAFLVLKMDPPILQETEDVIVAVVLVMLVFER